DGRMIGRRQHARLAFEARQSIGVRGEGRRQDLDRYVTPQPRVARPIDLAHPAGADRRQNFIRAQRRTSSQHRCSASLSGERVASGERVRPAKSLALQMAAARTTYNAAGFKRELRLPSTLTALLPPA